jgi:alcohol dehydrogenase
MMDESGKPDAGRWKRTVTPFDFQLRTRVVFGPGSIEQLGPLARQHGFSRTLIVADPGIVAAGHARRAEGILDAAGIRPQVFAEFGANPDTRMVEAGRERAAAHSIDSIVALGGGSSLDCAKGINFVLTNGGTMREYRGYGKASKPLLPSIGIPTTAGTGSDAQSYALISDAETHAKMACGDPKAAFRVAILDPELTVSQPRDVTAVAGYDALSHAVESYVTARRTVMSDLFARHAWQLLSGHFERVLTDPSDVESRGAMLVGAHEAGIAIELSMLGATHACANPLTARYGTTHGVAIAVMLPHVVRWNGGDEAVAARYAELLGHSDARSAGERLADQLKSLAATARLPATLRQLGAERADIPALAADAATQWTGTFNPRPFDVERATALYEAAYE